MHLSFVSLVQLFTDPDPLRTPAVGGCAQTPKLLCQLTQRLHLIRKAIRDYERHFEKERGRKPNTAEKKTDLKVLPVESPLSILALVFSSNLPWNCSVLVAKNSSFRGS